jgi:Flp pilus assembly pilin Flp
MENKRMSRTNQFLRSFLRDETGGEVMEYAMVAGLISIAAIAVIGSFGVKVLARWNSVNSSL